MLRTAATPAMPQPTTATSTSTVLVTLLSSISGSVPSQSFSEAAAELSAPSALTPMACSMQLAAAFLTALVVTVAPEMLSISVPCAAMMASCRVGAATPPMLSVSLEASMTTSVMAVSLKVMVTFTSPMPVAVPV